MMTRRQFLGTGSALVAAACAPVVSGLYDSAPLDDVVLGRCTYSGRFPGSWIYEESDYIRAFFEPGDLAVYRQAILSPLVMPERPLVRVSVINFYRMAYGPAYRESEISLLALHGQQPGWFLLTMPLTDGDACLGGRTYLGTPKVMRRVTLERGANQYVGTSFGWGGRAPDFTLTVDVGHPDEAARDVLRFALLPYLTLLGGACAAVRRIHTVTGGSRARGRPDASTRSRAPRIPARAVKPPASPRRRTPARRALGAVAAPLLDHAALTGCSKIAAWASGSCLSGPLGPRWQLLQ